MFGYWSYISGPEPIAKIQRFFGVERIISSNKNVKLKPVDDQQNYIVHNKIWYLLFRFASELAGETFSGVVFPIWFWNFDPAVGRKLATLWAISSFIGQALKDTICWPRPDCPPVVRIEKKWALEYGMPSTHSIISIILPFGLIILMDNGFDFMRISGAILFCLLISMSRFYLGMHSIADVLSGFAVAGLQLIFLIHLVHEFDRFVTNRSIIGPVLMMVGVVILVLIYPNSQYAKARDDTASILGFAFGLELGSLVVNIQYQQKEAIDISEVLMRAVIGLLSLAVVRALVKALMRITIDRIIENSRLPWKQLITCQIIGFYATWMVPTIIFPLIFQ